VKALRLLRLIALVVLCFCIFVNLVFGWGIGSSFFSGGPDAVRHWIAHIESEGRLQIKEISPGKLQVTFPSNDHPYRHFFLPWLGIAAFTAALFFALRFWPRQIRPHQRQP
jgi:hypothetical protein